MKRMLIATSLLALAACSRPPSKTVSPQPALRALGQQVTVAEVRSDETIGFEVRRQIDLNNPSELAGVIIQVEDGVVTLRGTAASRQAAWRAEGVTRAVPGVKTVINRIQFGGAGPRF